MTSQKNRLRLGTLNLGHQTIVPKQVPTDLLNALADLDADVWVLTEFVATPKYLHALASRWGHVLASPQVPCAAKRFHNQVAVASRIPAEVRAGLAPEPSIEALTNFLSVSVAGLALTGVRAPAYSSRPTWYAYWDKLREHLDGDVMIGDLNVDPTRRGKKDRVFPQGWRVVTPGGPSYRSLKNGTESTVDHALVRPGIEVFSAEYRPEFFSRWKLDHCPLLVEVETTAGP
jgi:Endonuclease/Exonuclease/phosphatase family